MTLFFDAWVSLRSFFELGGPVLFAIFAATLAMWVLIVERLWYLIAVLPSQTHAAEQEWTHSAGDGSWHANSIRQLIVSQVGQSSRRNLGLIQTLIQILPLMGLLGTVWGMVQIFENLTLFGTGNTRLMASGVALATLPTMAGLVAALSGLCVSAWLKHYSKQKLEELEERLQMRFEPASADSE